MKRKQIVALNSGGYDSVCLIHYLLETEYSGEEIVSVFFNYGQRNLEYERECARKVAYENSIKHIEVELPKFHWTKSSVTNKNGKSQYIEMRNLIFLSYGTSIAQSFKADTVATGLIYGGNYVDSTEGFAELLSEVTELAGVEIWTPFINCSKEQVGMLITHNVFEEGNFYSCNTPNDLGEPCGTCGDCLNLKDVKNFMETY